MWAGQGTPAVAQPQVKKHTEGNAENGDCTFINSVTEWPTKPAAIASSPRAMDVGRERISEGSANCGMIHLLSVRGEANVRMIGGVFGLRTAGEEWTSWLETPQTVGKTVVAELHPKDCFRLGRVLD